MTDTRDSDDSRDELRLLGSTLGGRFRIERVVARGGFGVVYKATQVSLERPVAIKVAAPPTGLDARATERFYRDFLEEARIVARFQHGHIAHVYDSGAAELSGGGRALWMALEWLDGRTLREDLRGRRGRGGRAMGDALAIFLPVLDAVAYAHERGVIHRDLKPANVMLIAGARGDTPKVLDFGIAKDLSRDLGKDEGATRTARTTPAFTPAYGAPEQFWGARTTRATDVHALALLLCELLTDKSPYGSNGEDDLRARAMDDDRPTPGHLGAPVSEAVEAVLRKALAISPKQRYADARAFGDALQHALSGRTISCADDSVSGPALEFVETTTERSGARAARERTDGGAPDSSRDPPPPERSTPLPPPDARKVSMRRTTAALGLVLLGVALAWAALWLTNVPATSARTLSAAAQVAVSARDGAVVANDRTLWNTTPPTTVTREAVRIDITRGGHDVPIHTPTPGRPRRPVPRAQPETHSREMLHEIVPAF